MEVFPCTSSPLLDLTCAYWDFSADAVKYFTPFVHGMGTNHGAFLSQAVSYPSPKQTTVRLSMTRNTCLCCVEIGTLHLWDFTVFICIYSVEVLYPALTVLG